MRSCAARGPPTALACDIDDDGWADVILINSYENAIHLDAGSFVYFGGPDGFAAEPDVVIPTRLGWACAIADLDRDGYLDLIVSHFHDPTITIYRGRSGGFDFEDPTVLTVLEGPGDYIPPRRMVLADFDRSGWLDLAIAPAGRNRCVILRGGPDGFSTERAWVLPTSFSAGYPVAHDITGNGYPDLLLGGGKPNPGQPHDSFNHVFWNGPDGLRADRQTQLPSNCGHGLAIADFDGDGVPDLLSCGYQSAVDRDVDAVIYWGNRDTGFRAGDFTRLRAHSSAGCLAADFDGDGRVDIAIANHKIFGDHVGRVLRVLERSGRIQRAAGHAPADGGPALAGVRPAPQPGRRLGAGVLRLRAVPAARRGRSCSGWTGRPSTRGRRGCGRRSAPRPRPSSSTASRGGVGAKRTRGWAAGSRCARTRPAGAGCSTGWRWGRPTAAAPRACARSG